MGMYSSGNVTYQTRGGIVTYADEGGRILFDSEENVRVPDFRERWEENGLEWDEDYIAKPGTPY